MHPVHPMLVHAPIACWTLTPICDALAMAMGRGEFWTIGAFLAGAGVLSGALAATVGALDFERGYKAAPKIAVAHATLMGGALIAASIGALGRLEGDYTPLSPPHWWAIGASAVALAFVIAGAWCGGEMVYGRGVGVRAVSSPSAEDR